MKTRFFFIVAAFALLSLPVQAQEVKQAIENNNFKIEVDKAMPFRGRMVNLSPSYELAVRGDSVFSYLPYFGVSHQSGYGDSDGGIKFAVPVKDYKVQYNEKKEVYTITFNARNRKDGYSIRIEIYINGATYINIIPGQSDPINYSGTMLMEKKIEAVTQNTFTHQVGECEVSLLSEVQQKIKTDLLIGATPEMLAECAPEGTIPNSMSAYMVRTPDKVVLVDAGLGAKIFDNMVSLGVQPEAVNAILITHMHYDHIGGLLRDGKVSFPNAEIYIAQPEVEYWSKVISQAGDNARKVLEAYKDHVHFFEPGQLNGEAKEVIPGFTGIFAPGHTPGHTMYMLHSGSEQFLFWGDLTHALAIQMPYPQVALTYDVNPELAIATRAAVLDYVSKNNIPIAGMHIQFPGMGMIKKVDKGYSFTPLQ